MIKLTGNPDTDAKLLPVIADLQARAQAKRDRRAMKRMAVEARTPATRAAIHQLRHGCSPATCEHARS